MTWKQPVPVHIPELRNDPFGETLFQKLIIMASNENREFEIEGTPISVKRGDVVIGRKMLAKMFGLKKSEEQRVYRKLIKLGKTNKLLIKRKSLNCSIVTLNNFDQLVEMNNPTINQQTNDEQTVNTYKNEKSKKSEVESEVILKQSQLTCTQTELSEIARSFKTTSEAIERELPIFNQWYGDKGKSPTNIDFLRWIKNAKNLPKVDEPAMSDEEILKRSIN
jgi:hypothetical protein